MGREREGWREGKMWEEGYIERTGENERKKIGISTDRQRTVRPTDTKKTKTGETKVSNNIKENMKNKPY